MAYPPSNQDSLIQSALSDIAIALNAVHGQVTEYEDSYVTADPAVIKAKIESAYQDMQDAIVEANKE